jgi:peptide/nickel transport system ATP-binding protein
MLGRSLDANDTLLEVRGLKTHFFLDEGVVKAVDGVDLKIRRGETLCVVGESGCGKSVTARSILQLVDRPGRIVEGEILLSHDPQAEPNGAAGAVPEGAPTDGGATATTTREVLDLASLDPRSKAMRDIRGKEISMIFQEPMTSLSPVHTIGDQITENVLLHLPMNKQEARDRTVEELGRVGIPNPERRVDAYPFQLSGGMRQRAMIAMALSCNPSLLIADEPTTALDVTTQAQILDLMRDLQSKNHMAIMLITHDLGVIAEMADEVVVMYLGRVVEKGPVDDIFHNPKHPYTRALLESIPSVNATPRVKLPTISGSIPHPYARPAGCPFYPRCTSYMPGTGDAAEPELIHVGDNQDAACFLYGGVPAGVGR